MSQASVKTRYESETEEVILVERIARVCHEANRAYCQSIGDDSQVSWDNAPDWQRESARDGVRWRLQNRLAPYSASHERWCLHKVQDGWTYGSVKDPEKKEHPCLVLFEELPEEQQRKDMLFTVIVLSLSGEGAF